MGRASLWVVVVVALLPVSAANAARAAGFRVTVAPVTAALLGGSYRAGCPVGPSALRRLSLPYWGFDGKAHHGSLIVNASVVTAVESAFGHLYAERFPIRRMRPVAVYGGSDDRSMAADNTSGFNCRAAVSTGPKQWSAHAYGEAIDVNPLENPYVLGDSVLPPGGASFRDRGDVRAGMAVLGGQLVSAFAAVGWQWGGRWTGSPDYQHFSSTGG